MIAAYSNKKAVKNRYIKQFNAHIEADNLIRGTYVKSVNSHWNGCAITCMLNAPNVPRERVKTDHSAFESEPIQFPEWLGLLIDAFHENTSGIEFSQAFQVRLLKAIPVGFTNWNLIQCKFLRFVLEDCKANNPEAVQPVIDLFDREIAGDPPTHEEWSAAGSAAGSAAAARSAAGLAARSAAWLAARSAARSAAESAARSAAESAAESAAYDKYAIHLAELFEAE